jgi:hypothetical protein
MDVMQYASGDAPARAVGGAGGIATLAAGKLYALQHSYALDGRVSSVDRARLLGGELLSAQRT